MLKLFERLFHGCAHQWKTVEKIDLIEVVYGTKYIVGKAYYLECKKCGRMKKQTFMN